jgi:hypothetical protein
MGDLSYLIAIKTLVGPMYILAGRGLAEHFVRKDRPPQPLWETIEQTIAEGLLFGAFLAVMLASPDTAAPQVVTTFLLAGLGTAGARWLLRFGLRNWA